eukprot:TRINITY_DN2259_c0_g1_i5.p1 TRINITY_DN2259_c0_g1~~TRINITY_DN2259_c0_g1_i5.p1  ORF type:complete len:1345 (+),score=283.06 TRINITY_DN2259_c0_g1_i5:350-4036(+)
MAKEREIPCFYDHLPHSRPEIQSTEHALRSNFEPLSKFCETARLPREFEHYLVTSRDKGRESATGAPTTQHPVEFHFGRWIHVLVIFYGREWCEELKLIGAARDCDDSKKELAKLLKTLTPAQIEKYAGKAVIFGRDRSSIPSLFKDRLEVQRTLAHLSADEAGRALGALIKEIHVFVPSRLLHNGGSLIDAPGTNDGSAAREERLKSALKTADVVLVMIRGSLVADKETKQVLVESETFQNIALGKSPQTRLIVIQNPEGSSDDRDTLQRIVSRAEQKDAEELKSEIVGPNAGVRETLAEEVFRILQEQFPTLDETALTGQAEEIIARQTAYLSVRPTLALSCHFNQHRLSAVYQEHGNELVDRALRMTGFAHLLGLIETTPIQHAWAAARPAIENYLHKAPTPVLQTASSSGSSPAVVRISDAERNEHVKTLEQLWSTKRARKGQATGLKATHPNVKVVSKTIDDLRSFAENKRFEAVTDQSDLTPTRRWCEEQLLKRVREEPVTPTRRAPLASALALTPRPTITFFRSTFLERNGTVDRTNPLRFGQTVRDILEDPNHSPLKAAVAKLIELQKKAIESTAQKMRAGLLESWLPGVNLSSLPHGCRDAVKNFEVQIAVALQSNFPNEAQLTRDTCDHILATVDYHKIFEAISSRLENCPPGSLFATALAAVKEVLVPELADAMARGYQAAKPRSWWLVGAKRLEKLSTGSWAAGACKIRSEVVKMRFSLVDALKTPGLDHPTSSTSTPPMGQGKELFRPLEDANKVFLRWEKANEAACIEAGEAQLEWFVTHGLVFEELATVVRQPAQFCPRNAANLRVPLFDDLPEVNWDSFIKGHSNRDAEKIIKDYLAGDRIRMIATSSPFTDVPSELQPLSESRPVQLCAALLRGWVTNEVTLELAAALRQALLIYVRNRYGLTKDSRAQFERNHDCTYEKWIKLQSSDGTSEADRVFISAFAEFAQVDVTVLVVSHDGVVKKRVIRSSKDNCGMVLVAYGGRDVGFMLVERKSAASKKHAEAPAAGTAAAHPANMPASYAGVLVVDTSTMLAQAQWEAVCELSREKQLVVAISRQAHEELTRKKEDDHTGPQARRVLKDLLTKDASWVIETDAHYQSLLLRAGRLGKTNREWGDQLISWFAVSLQEYEKSRAAVPIVLVTADKDFSGLSQSHGFECVILDQADTKTKAKQAIAAALKALKTADQSTESTRKREAPDPEPLEAEHAAKKQRR